MKSPLLKETLTGETSNSDESKTPDRPVAPCGHFVGVSNAYGWCSACDAFEHIALTRGSWFR